jgi:DNA helicase-2/ATP-dependent DNA helicase PcrA
LWVDKSPKIKKLRLKKLEDLLNPINLKLVSTLLEVKKASKQSLSTTLKISRFSKISTYLNVIIEVQRRFAKSKKKKGVIDFADMLVEAIKIIDEKPLSVPFTHILVDEYQDCSAAQTKLLAKLTNLPRRSIIVFGDQYQSIFGFTGASYTPLSSVLDGVETLSLPFSHRLTEETAALASAVAKLPKGHAIKTNSSGDKPALVNNKSLTDQTKRVVEDIKLLIADGAKPQNIVVLARTKAQLGYIEAALLAQNLLSDRKGLTRERRNVIRVLKLVRIVERCIKNDERVKPEMLRDALPDITDVIDTRWKKETSKLQKVLATPSLEGRYNQCTAIYLRLLGGVRKNPELRAEVNSFEPFSRGYENATAMRHAIKNMDANCVATSTIHAAKGQEWDHVLIVGVTDGILPIYHAKDEQSLAEERNLLYVAITRARKTVRLYHAPTPHAKSRRKYNELCQFINTPAVKKTLMID